MNGLDRVRAYAADPMPMGGMLRLLSARLVHADHGRATFAATPTHDHLNPGGTVHGGYLATLLDSALGTAALTVLGSGLGCTTLELKVSFLRPCRATGAEVTAEATVTRPGRRVVFTEGRLTDEAGQTVATASSTLLVTGTEAAL